MDQSPSYNDLVQRIKELEDILQTNASQEYNKAILESEERFKALSEATNEGIFITEKGVCLEVNKSGCELFGYSYDEAIGMLATQMFTKESAKIVKDNIRKEFDGKYEAIGVRKDGTTFYAEIQGHNYNYKGKNVRIAAIRDITEQKHAQKALEESELKFREVVENAGDGILVGNLKGEIIEVNKGYLNMTGYERDEVLNKHIKTIFAPDILDKKPLRFDLLNKGQSIIIEREILGKDGTRIPVEMNSKRPHANYYLAVVRDLSERKKAKEALIRKNEELIVAKEKAEESDRLKSAFLANMSHEIRTPMNGIIGFAELLKSSDCSEEANWEYLDVIISSGHQLLNIINDVLEISRIETGQLKLISNSVNVCRLIKELKMFFTPLAHHHNNRLEIVIPDYDVHITGDAAKLKQVLTNLISNAIKFTHNGVVRITLEEIDEFISFSVSDTGIGIPEEYKDKIFERFLQVERHNKIQSGTGLGLSICKKLVELMKGEIWVESTINSGSIFTFILPLVLKL